MLVTICVFTQISIVQCRSSSAVFHVSFRKVFSCCPLIPKSPTQTFSIAFVLVPFVPLAAMLDFAQDLLRSGGPSSYIFTELPLGDLLDEVFCMSSISRGIYVSIMLGRLHSFRCHTKGGAMSKPCGDQICVLWPQTGESLPYKHNRNLSNILEILYPVVRP